MTTEFILISARKPKITYTDLGQGYQVIRDGNVIDYVDLNGNPLNLPVRHEINIVDPEPDTPEWASEKFPEPVE